MPSQGDRDRDGDLDQEIEPGRERSIERNQEYDEFMQRLAAYHEKRG